MNTWIEYLNKFFNITKQFVSIQFVIWTRYITTKGDSNHSMFETKYHCNSKCSGGKRLFSTAEETEAIAKKEKKLYTGFIARKWKLQQIN
jgi:hypothetical protein